MIKSISSNPVASLIFRMFSILMALGLCLTPALVSQPVLAGPPPGSSAATTFTSSSSTTPSGTAPATQTTVATDKFQYQPDETASISGGGYAPGSTVSITLTGPDGKTTTWTVTADASGNITTSYNMASSTEGAYTIQLSDGTNSATTMFTDPTSTAILYPSSNVQPDLENNGTIFHHENPDHNWNYVNDPVSTSGSPATGNDGDHSVVYTWITGDSWGHNTPTTDIYQFTTLPAGYQLYTTSGSLQTPTPTNASGHTVGIWSNNNKVTMQWNSVPSGTVTNGPSVTVNTVCREKGLGAEGRVQIVMSQPTAGGTQLYYYTPAQGQDMTGSWALYSVTMPNSPDGDAWTASDFTALKGGVSLSEIGNPLGWAGMTQMYIEVSPGVMAPVLANYNYHWDGASNTSTTGTNTGQITLTDGTHTFYVNAQDTTGGTTPYGTSGPYLIDTRGPTLTKLINGTAAKSGWYNATDAAGNQLIVQLNADDTNGTTPVSGVNSITYKVGSAAQNTETNTSTAGATGNGKSATQSVTFVISTAGGANQGAVTLQHSATDVAGNTGSSPAGSSQVLYIDTQSPLLTKTLTGTVGKNGWHTSSTVGVQLNASDPTPGSGVDNIQYAINSNPVVTATNTDTTGAIGTGKSSTFSTSTTVNTQGVNTISHVAYDVAGNSSANNPGSATSPQTIKIDSGSPLLTKSLSGTTGNSGWYKSNVGVTLNASDATSGVDTINYQVNSNPAVTATNTNVVDATNSIKSSTFSTGTTISTEGVNTISHTAYDMAGNSSANNPGSATSPQTIKIDTQSPLLTKNLSGTAGNNGWYKSSVGVTLNASDATPGSGVDSIQYSVNGAPVVTSTNLNVVDAVNSVKTSTHTTGTTISTEGVNTISHTAYDVAGNSSANNPLSATSPQNINVDTGSPLLTKTLTGTSGENGWYTSAVGVKLNASDATSGVDTINLKVNSGPTVGVINTTLVDSTNLIKSSTFSVSTTISTEGVNTISHTAYDMAGNSSANNPGSATSPQTVSVDTVKPVLTKTINGAAPRDSTVNNGWYNAADAPSGKLTVALNASDATSGVQNISYTKDGGAATTVANPAISGSSASSTQSTTFDIAKQGTTTLTHQTKDMAGNTYVLEAQNVKLDTILPTLAKSVARTGLDQVTVTLNGADDTSGSGINNIVYSADGGTAVTVLGSGAYSKNTTFVITGTGSHDLTHSILDIAGNQYTLAAQSVAIAGPSTNTRAFVPNSPISVLTLSLQGGPITSHPVTSTGMLISDADVTSPDGMVLVSIPAGTTVLNADGTPAYLNKDPDLVSVAAANSAAPAGYQMVSSYELTPNGLTFDSPITLAINYDPAKLPKGTQPVIAFFDEGASKWVDLETAGFIAADGEAAPHTAAARVNHFTRFAVLAK